MTAYLCGCGKQLTSLSALHQHRTALGCETAKQRKNRKSSRRLKVKHRTTITPTQGDDNDR
jgi:hypothetical protein